ncbi:MAG: phosphatidylglycerophosphatase A [Candidatus Omnitrophota bacterium]
MKKKLIILITTVCYAGYFPCASGTFTSLLAAIICYLTWRHPLTYLTILILSGVIGFMFSGQAEEIFQKKDASYIVIDEFCGMFIAFLFIKLNLAILVIGFLLFRILDIVKPLNIRKLEKLASSWGIMLDDISAGVLTNVILQLGIVFYRVF